MASRESEQESTFRLFSERVINETWSKAEQYKEEIELILERGTVESDRDISLLLIAANAFIQKVTLSDADNHEMGLEEFSLVPCGKEYKSCDSCGLEDCDYFQ